MKEFITCPTHKIVCEIRGYHINLFQTVEANVCPIDNEVID